MKTRIDIPEGLPSKIVAGKSYRVQLAKTVSWRGMSLSPAEQHGMKGSVLSEIKESVYGAVEEELPGSVQP